MICGMVIICGWLIGIADNSQQDNYGSIAPVTPRRSRFPSRGTSVPRFHLADTGSELGRDPSLNRVRSRVAICFGGTAMIFRALADDFGKAAQAFFRFRPAGW
jgi:hypothetical protein